MAVILPNCTLALYARAHPVSRDARGKAINQGDGSDMVAVRGPRAGALTEPDGDTGPQSAGWRFRADPALWPIVDGDYLKDDRGRIFHVRQARLIQVPGASEADFIRGNADLDPPLQA